MMKKLGCFLLIAMFGACLCVHRRVILALIRGEEMPQAPAWHFWCKNRAEA